MRWVLKGGETQVSAFYAANVQLFWEDNFQFQYCEIPHQVAQNKAKVAVLIPFDLIPFSSHRVTELIKKVPLCGQSLITSNGYLEGLVKLKVAMAIYHKCLGKKTAITIF